MGLHEKHLFHIRLQRPQMEQQTGKKVTNQSRYLAADIEALRWILDITLYMFSVSEDELRWMKDNVL
jgi:hypothetical protein